MRDNKGQLLLLAVVFLAITLIVLASAATVFLSVKQNQMDSSFAVEYDNVKEKFGFALNESANQTYGKGGVSKTDAINDSFDKTRDSFMILLSYHGINFDAELYEIGDDYVLVNLTMMREKEYISESVNYTVVL